jgi:hypothetical protein
MPADFMLNLLGCAVSDRTDFDLDTRREGVNSPIDKGLALPFGDMGSHRLEFLLSRRCPLSHVQEVNKVEDDIIKFKIVLSEKVSEYYLDTGGVIVVPNGSIMIKSNDRGIEVISRSAFEELYILDKKIPWYKSLLKSLKHLH